MRSRPEEGSALIRGALALAQEHDLAAGPRAFMNLADILNNRDRCDESAAGLRQGLVLARRMGHSFWEATLLGELSWPLALSGEWDEALACFEQLPEEQPGLGTFLVSLPELLIARGRLADARRLLGLYGRYEESVDVQERPLWKAAQAVVLRGEGRNAEALRAAEDALAAIEVLGPASQPVKVAFPQAVDAALALDDRNLAEQLLARIEALPPGTLAPTLRAHSLRFRARLAALDGSIDEADAGYATAAGTFREFGMPFLLAVTLLEHNDALRASGRAEDAEPMLAEARETFERLEAVQWLERIDGIGVSGARERAAAGS